MHIEEGPHSSRHNVAESQPSIQRIDQQSSLHSHRTFDSGLAGQDKSKSQQLIAIKIIDGEKKVIKTFIEKKDLIVGQMRYFAQHLGRDSSERKVEDSDKDIVDI